MRITDSLISVFVIRCLDSIIPPFSITEISSLYLVSVSYLVENPEERFSRDEAQMKVYFFFPFQQGLASCFIFPRVDLYPYLLNGLVHPYQLDESISNFRGVWCTLSLARLNEVHGELLYYPRRTKFTESYYTTPGVGVSLRVGVHKC